jgi:hypothetical protein
MLMALKEGQAPMTNCPIPKDLCKRDLEGDIVTWGHFKPSSFFKQLLYFSPRDGSGDPIPDSPRGIPLLGDGMVEF